jgi:hypothetical protein
LSFIQNFCKNNGEVDKEGEGKELHLDLVTSVGLLGLMCMATQLRAAEQTIYANFPSLRLATRMLNMKPSLPGSLLVSVAFAKEY